LECEWIAEKLLTRTQDVWSRYLGREVPREEATAIPLNVQQIAFTFHQIAQQAEEEKAEETQAGVPESSPAKLDKLVGWERESARPPTAGSV